jgi:mRNA interferase RelE/StbE
LSYRIEVTKSALKQLKKLDASVSGSIKEALLALAENPRPVGVKKLKGTDNDYRVRVGDYRIVYSIEDDRLLVTVIKVAHRREVYR